MSDTREKLSATSVGLHWVIGLTTIGMVIFGLVIADMPKGDAKGAYIGLHKSIGILVLVFASWRVVRRLRIGMLDAAGTPAPWEHTLASIIASFLLFATLALPLSGIVMTLAGARPVAVFGATVIPQLLTEKNELLGGIGHKTHEILGYLLLAAVSLHIAGALKHHVLDRDGTLKRMLGARIDPVKRA